MGYTVVRTLVFDDCERTIDSPMSHQKRAALARKINEMKPQARKAMISDLLKVLSDEV